MKQILTCWILKNNTFKKKTDFDLLNFNRINGPRVWLNYLVLTLKVAQINQVK